ncbi:MAG TPA: hypothetical protein VIC26_02315 [Marinagarivorans sp.]
MSKPNTIHDPTLFAGLTALAKSSFPKRCNNCGRSYPNVESFIAETRAVQGHSGLKAAKNEAGDTMVELFRNCVCGSTLLDFFNDRRDLTDEGLRRRRHFGELLHYLESRGIGHQQARLEVLKVMQGEGSRVLSELPPDQ